MALRGDGKKHGGTPVKIVGGKIVSGPKRLRGKSIKRLASGKPNQAVEYRRAVHKAVKEHGVKEQDLHDAIEFVHGEKKIHHDERETAKEHARQLTGLTAGDVSRLANAGHDYSSGKKAGGATGEKLRHFDEFAEEVAREHPELGLGHGGDAAEGLWNVLAEGKRSMAAKHDPYVPKGKITEPSKAKLHVAKEHRAAVNAAAKKLGVRAKDLPSLVGAPDDAHVHAEVNRRTGSLTAAVTHPAFRFIRRLGTDKHGEKFIENGNIRVNDDQQGYGIGTHIFARQVHHAANHGFSYITADAVKSPEHNGYYTWPQLGYDKPISELEPEDQEAVHNEFPQAKSVLDIFEEPGGAEWWLNHGVDLYNALFDLKPPSRSRDWLDGYVAKKGIQ